MKIPTSRKVHKNKTAQSSRTITHHLSSPSAYKTEGQEIVEDVVQPFRFLDLPLELRNQIYQIHFYGVPSVLDLDPDNYKVIHAKFPLFLTSKQVNYEAAHQFYATHTIRLFPTHPGRFFKTKRPLLARLPSHHRKSVTSLQLRLGPGFTNPPSGWVVNNALGLRDSSNVRLLAVFVEVDTSDPIFNGFRREEDGFYERFSWNLLGKVLMAVPSIVKIQFDAYPSVRKDGDMMRGLLEVANKYQKLVSWGPERGWNKQEELNCVNRTAMDDLPTKTTSLEISGRVLNATTYGLEVPWRI